MTRILLALGLILAVATPALAEFKLNGYYRLMGYSAEVRSGAATVEGGYAADTKDEEGDSRQMIDQRLRMMLTYSLNDNVSIVYHGEIDTVWGETSKGNIGGGGKLGSDGVNVETKNVYLDLKSGGTSARLGIQTIADSYQGIAFFDDMAGVNFTHKMGNTTLNLAYSKWDEGTSSNSRSNYDDSDLYVADIKQKFNDNFTVGASVYFLQDNTQEDLATAAGLACIDANANNKCDAGETVIVPTAAGAAGSSLNARESELYYYGLNAAVKFGNFGIDGFFLMMDGENDYLNKADNDIEAYAASAKVNMKLGNGDVGLRAMYFSDDDDAKDDGAWRTPTGRYDFVNDNLMQFLTDKFICNYGKERYAMADAAEAGYGLLGLVASGNHKLPADMYLNWGAGYFRALEDERNGGAKHIDNREGKTLGWEVAARVGKKFFEKVDVSLNGSYADYGDFYDYTSTGLSFNTDGSVKTLGDDPDATYKAYLMVNVPF